MPTNEPVLSPSSTPLLGYSSSGQAVRASVPSPGIGESGARARLAFRTAVRCFIHVANCHSCQLVSGTSRLCRNSIPFAYLRAKLAYFLAPIELRRHALQRGEFDNTRDEFRFRTLKSLS
jgi:hypothetical protein